MPRISLLSSDLSVRDRTEPSGAASERTTGIAVCHSGAMPELSRSGEVFVLHLGEGDLRFTPTSLAEIGSALDAVESTDGPSALVTAASGKIWHNGLDLDHMATLGDRFLGYIAEVQELFARLLTLRVPTVAAIQGHAFAGGAMLALCHDQRVMRSDRGFLCLPEVDLGMPFSDGMAALISSKLRQPLLHRMAVLGERIGGTEARTLGAVDSAVDSESAVLAEAMSRAAELAPKAKPTIAALRRNLYGQAIDALLAI
ncbi:MAG: enoyl-CoA hydratase-related protein [Ilumatobacteraceae bacterium]